MFLLIIQEIIKYLLACSIFNVILFYLCIYLYYYTQLMSILNDDYVRDGVIQHITLIHLNLFQRFELLQTTGGKAA